MIIFEKDGEKREINSKKLLLMPDGSTVINPKEEHYIKAGWVEFIQNPPAPTPEETAKQLIELFESAIQNHLDTTAMDRGYDGIISACSYKDDPDPVFKSEGMAAYSWRSAVWAYSRDQLAAITGGQRQAPPTPADFINELPTISW